MNSHKCSNHQPKIKAIKCLVWDLDYTIWDGILLEDSSVQLLHGVTDIIKELDARGILQSIASKNHYEAANEKLKELGIDQYFLYPQINWNAKSESIKKIAEQLNIGIDSIAFIDDQEFELDEVKHELPEVLCINAHKLADILKLPEINSIFITDESRLRRLMYMNDMERNKAEAEYTGPKEEFLAGLGMRVTISRVAKEDLKRVEELTVRTHQLNTTGRTYSYEELEHIRESDSHLLLTAALEDKYGSYGKIALVMLECIDKLWTIKLFLMSCRVMSKGIGTVLLNYIMDYAKKLNAALRAEFIQNERNRMMYITLKFAGFQEIMADGNYMLLESDLSRIQPFPDYIQIKVDIGLEQ